MAPLILEILLQNIPAILGTVKEFSGSVLDLLAPASCQGIESS
jgi:hypothetical protein